MTRAGARERPDRETQLGRFSQPLGRRAPRKRRAQLRRAFVRTRATARTLATLEPPERLCQHAMPHAVLPQSRRFVRQIQERLGGNLLAATRAVHDRQLPRIDPPLDRRWRHTEQTRRDAFRNRVAELVAKSQLGEQQAPLNARVGHIPRCAANREGRLGDATRAALPAHSAYVSEKASFSLTSRLHPGTSCAPARSHAAPWRRRRARSSPSRARTRGRRRRGPSARSARPAGSSCPAG